MRYLVANLKMKLVSEQEHAEYCVALGEALKGVKKKKDVRLVVCPSFPFLGDFKKKLPKGAMLGAQDVHWEEVGAYTGGVSPRSLADFGVLFNRSFALARRKRSAPKGKRSPCCVDKCKPLAEGFLVKNSNVLS
jgi:triosephosphate isomerase